MHIQIRTVTLSGAKGRPRWIPAKRIRRSRTCLPEHRAPASPPSASHGIQRGRSFAPLNMTSSVYHVMGHGDHLIRPGRLQSRADRWRQVHPQATFADLEIDATRQAAALRAELIAVTLATGDPETAPVCPACGTTMSRSGTRCGRSSRARRNRSRWRAAATAARPAGPSFPPSLTRSTWVRAGIHRGSWKALSVSARPVRSPRRPSESHRSGFTAYRPGVE